MIGVAPAKPFDSQVLEVEKFIEEKDKKSQNKCCCDIESARRLLIAIENARNILTVHCSSETKEDEFSSKFNQMFKCLQQPETEYDRNDLEKQITRSMISGTSDWWAPKLLEVSPTCVTPTSQFTIQFFGQFPFAAASYKGKYPPSFEINDRTFGAVSATVNTLTFNINTSQVQVKFNEKTCTTLKGRLTVLYENGTYLKDVKRFTFDVLIRAFPNRVGEGTFSYTTKDKHQEEEEVVIYWNLSHTVACPRTSKICFNFTAFDGQNTTLTKVGRGPYLQLSREAIDSDLDRWVFTPIPPMNK